MGILSMFMKKAGRNINKELCLKAHGTCTGPFAHTQISKLPKVAIMVHFTLL